MFSKNRSTESEIFSVIYEASLTAPLNQKYSLVCDNWFAPLVWTADMVLYPQPDAANC
jgi:hypothetical protein